MGAMRNVLDRFDIEELRAEVTDAVMMRDFDRVASLFTPDGTMRWPHIDKEFIGREEIRAGIEWGQGLWEFFVQNTHPGVIRLDCDTAVGRVYIQEFGRMHNGSSHLNYALYHDRYQRTSDGWKFAERVYEVRYLDSTPLAGSPLHAAPGA
ncbi:nuclear transport factor 2 family protein [Streptomyces sp. NBC_01408]|uniref:nuclear transport factor 2 family protein n=1 Tax=Streptomyces sp. NBC_01408 TaxID=2903855 RepID=UPI00224F59E0|nr:nuclear transport factor 2 family protein [Streptomyces sp. NBC_01408]MCX4695863.1 nuclear transport factor 2 family protein [Streptomyces sp. NBC_01408]